MSNYVDNNIPIGSITADIKSGAGSGTTYLTGAVFDDLTINAPGVRVQRTDQIGQDNGWVLVPNTINGSGPPVTGTGTVQIPTMTSGNQLSGKWFKYAFDPSSTAQAQMVICDVSQPYTKDGYFKCNVTLALSRTPPTA